MEIDSPNVDNLIDRLMKAGRSSHAGKLVLSEFEIVWLCKACLAIFKSQPALIELVPPLTICGDVHGQYVDLLRLLDLGGSPANVNYLFLGDYVDRGSQSVNTIALLLAYKKRYPENFFLLRGNHECAEINRLYGFFDECVSLYGEKNEVYQAFNDVFDYLPISAVIDGRILCIHGGISPELKTLQQLRDIERPSLAEDHSLVSDLIWSDPDRSTASWAESDRGTSYLFGEEPLQTFLKNNDLELLVRAHQAIDDGFDFPFAPSFSTVTLFSAPNYCGECNNKAGMMFVDEHLEVTFGTIDPLPIIRRRDTDADENNRRKRRKD